MTEESTKSSGILEVLFPHLLPTLFSFFSILAAWLFIAGKHRRQIEMQRKTSVNSPDLGSSFDSQDAYGWGGHTAEAAGHPELVRFNFREILGRGSNGTLVFDGLYGSMKVAVKRILRRPEFEKSWIREHRILLKNRHENLIQCYWTGSSQNFHYIVLQFCTTTLLDVFNRTANSGMRPLLAFGLTGVHSIQQLVNAVSFLHRNEIVHRDIKPGNIFLLETTVENRFRMVLGDFGLALSLQNGNFHNSLALLFSTSTDSLAALPEDRECDIDQQSDILPLGSLGWMAPELCDLGSASLTKSVDVFSLGLVAFFILSEGKHPFESNPDSTGVRHTDGNIRIAASSFMYNWYSIQQAINENRRTQNLSLSEYYVDFDCEDRLAKVQGMLSYQLIEDALHVCPVNRSSIDVLASSPLFWTPGEVMTFYTEMSNFLDEPKQTSSVNISGTDPPEVDLLSTQRKSMLIHLEHYAIHVFSSSWLRHLDQVLVDDLRSVRSYQENSVVHLLRAIRNKRNHLWTLDPSVRRILGETDKEMAAYWNSRFPSLLPLLFLLSRCHLHALPHFQRFWPNVSTDFKLSCERAQELLLHCKPTTLAPWKQIQVGPEKTEENIVDNFSIDIKMKSGFGSPDKYKRTRKHRPRVLQKT